MTIRTQTIMTKTIRTRTIRTKTIRTRIVRISAYNLLYRRKSKRKGLIKTERQNPQRLLEPRPIFSQFRSSKIYHRMFPAWNWPFSWSWGFKIVKALTGQYWNLCPEFQLSGAGKNGKKELERENLLRRSLHVPSFLFELVHTWPHQFTIIQTFVSRARRQLLEEQEEEEEERRKIRSSSCLCPASF